MRHADPRIALLLDVLEHAYHGRGWHGTTLRGALRGVTPAQARWRPAPRRHCIWELVLHMTAWTQEVEHRLAGQPSGEPEIGDWPAVGQVTEARWATACAAPNALTGDNLCPRRSKSSSTALRFCVWLRPLAKRPELIASG